MSGYFDPTKEAVQPGLYLRFLELASLQLKTVGVGAVGIPVVNYTGGTAVAGKVYQIEDIETAKTVFGEGNVKSIEFALKNAEKVVAFALPVIDGTTVTEEVAYDQARLAFDTEFITVFVYDGVVSADEQDRAIRWLSQSKEEGREFSIVFGCSDPAEDQDPAIGDARTLRLAHSDAVNLIVGTVIDGVVYNSAQYAPYLAGLVAACPMNKSITFTKLSGVQDVNKRLTYAQTKASIKAGSLVLTQTGTAVRVETGLVTNGTKLRKALIRQGVMRDVKKAIEEEVIGQYSNDKDAHNFVISMVKRYLEDLQKNGVLFGIKVELSTEFESTADEMYVDIHFTEQDSLEKVYLTVIV